MITFVTFYMALSTEKREHLRESTSSFSVSDDALVWIDLLFRSARYFHDDCRCVLLTDKQTALTASKTTEVFRYSFCAGDPLWNRLIANRDFLRASDDSSHIAFVDFDILLNAALTPVFADTFDVALTHRPHHSMPINAGVMLVKAGSREPALAFFDQLLEIYEERFQQDPWWGEQLALALMLGDSIKQEIPPSYIETAVAQIRILPGAEYNYTPNRTRNLFSMGENVSLLHFKGKRKPMMWDHWAAHHLRSEQPNAPGCRFQEMAARLRLTARAVLNR
jgi:hypothetical protein